jgi:hypothetical protein
VVPSLPDQTDVFPVDNKCGSTTHVTWVQSAGAWQGPLRI